MTESEQLTRLNEGHHHDPHTLLGCHPTRDGKHVVRAMLPLAEIASVVGLGPMQRITGTDIFELISAAQPPLHPVLEWTPKDGHANRTETLPYTFLPVPGELDLDLFACGRHFHAYRFLGAHMKTIDGVDGCAFAVWAPGVERVSVVGDFNQWHGLAHPMRVLGHSGIWELFIPGVAPGSNYKFEIRNRHGQVSLKCDPYGQAMGLRPENHSVVTVEPSFNWRDDAWMERRAGFDWQHEAISVYEVHAGAWRVRENGDFLSWGELAEQLIPYVTHLNYTHIELMPVSEHPLDESWGYQVSGYFAPTSRYGSPDDFRDFIDRCHQAGLGVIIDWVPGHFPKDEFALARFTGEALYEHADPRKGEHRDWGTLIFDYDRNEVRNFLLTNAVYWLEEFHIDGLRVDAVASMLYLDYSREAGDWVPNRYGGRENLEAIAFLREMNQIVHGLFPGAVTFAEESTAWPMVSRPVELGGLGFSMKWNMGWMNDTLSYMEEDPVHRKYHHNKLTFSQIYAWTENFILPFSHDEVVHLKRSMLSKMPGDDWQKFANLRLLFAWQYAHPGKKLQFMGNEFGQWSEWNVKTALAWELLNNNPMHGGLHDLTRDLNTLYREEPGLHKYDFISDGFRWIDCDDCDQSVISLIRQSDDEHDDIVAVLNFTPVVRENYRIGIPSAGVLRELVNTDATHYGGSGVSNGAEIPTNAEPWGGFEQSVTLRLPPLGALFYKVRT